MKYFHTGQVRELKETWYGLRVNYLPRGNILKLYQHFPYKEDLRLSLAAFLYGSEIVSGGIPLRMWIWEDQTETQIGRLWPSCGHLFRYMTKNFRTVRDVAWMSANGLHLCKWTVALIQVLSHLNKWSNELKAAKFDTFLIWGMALVRVP